MLRFQNFWNENFNPQYKEHPGQPNKLDSQRLKQLLDKNPYQVQEELTEEPLCDSTSNFHTITQTWKNIEGRLLSSLCAHPKNKVR